MKKSFLVIVWFLQLSPLFILSQVTPEPQINSVLTGTVTDGKTRTALEGATVQIKGTTHYVLTDKDGKFSFKTAQKLPMELVVNFVGYQPLEITATESTLQLSLQEGQTRLSEVVVIGYGTQRRSDLTGAVQAFRKRLLQGQHLLLIIFYRARLQVLL